MTPSGFKHSRTPRRSWRPVATAALLVSLGACAAHAPAPQSAAQQTATNALASPVVAKTLLQSLTSWDGKGLSYPAGTAQVTALEISLAPGAQTGWHQHPVPSLAYILEGELEVSLRDGTHRRFSAGQAVAEVVNTVHNGRNPGTSPARLVVFYVGAVDLPLTVVPPKVSGQP